MEQPSSFWLLLAVFAPVITGLVSMRVRQSLVTPRVLVALAGPVISFLSVLIHLMTHGVAATDSATKVITWIPDLNLNLAFLADGLGGFFALLVSGIGILIVLYARPYFGMSKDEQYRFYPTLGFFTTAMMGIVLSDYMLLTLLFWEMTSISSFFLIGWYRYEKESVHKAMQAFFTTGLGGMALLGGILMFGGSEGIWRWSDVAGWSIHDAQNPGMVIAAFCMMLAGAATKSAQWPWSYWLPGAMVAPTPVSTFLHSATMVKAGVFLVGRMYPVFHELTVWPWLILIPGAITMLYGAVTALNQHDLKRIFAYTTVSQLGLLMCAYGLGAFEVGHEGHHFMAIDWDVTQIANHAFYKAPLFIIAGAIAHVAGTRDLPKLYGFWRVNKPMVIVMLLAGYALAGGPGTISFPAKELFFYAIYHAFEIHWIFQVLAVMAVLTAVCNVAIFVRLFTTLLGLPFGQRDLSFDVATEAAHGHGHGDHEHAHHDVGFWASMLWVPGAILVAWQYVGGLLPNLWSWIFKPLEANINYEAFADRLPFVWEVHWGVPLMMSLIAIGGGLVVGLSPLMRGAIGDVHDRIYPFLYWLCVHGGGRAFRTFQNGNFRWYVVAVVSFLVLGFAGAVYYEPAMLDIHWGSPLEFWPGMLLGVVICASALMLPIVEKRVIRVLVLGACGFSVVGMYLIYQAPDLALTQLMFELISVILFVLVLRMLPTPDVKKSPGKLWRIVISASVGITMGWMTLLAANSGTDPVLGPFFEANSYTGTEATGFRGGGGRNIVNVVLVDFRGFDTLGEITVLSIAALGVWALLPGRTVRRLEAKFGTSEGGAE